MSLQFLLRFLKKDVWKVKFLEDEIEAAKTKMFRLEILLKH